MFWIDLSQGSILVRRDIRQCRDYLKNDLRITYRDPKSMLLEAIFNGNIKDVKHLIGSGIDKNTVFHSPMRWEGATVMGASAYQGHIEIVEYLVDTGASVNFTDPCLGRTALHWGCMNGQYQVVSFLLRSGADVNHMGKDGVTPLIHATLGQYCDIVNLLIKNGANVNHIDKLKCSALHYATIHGNKAMIKSIIKGGGMTNHLAVIGKGSPFDNLIYQRNRDSCLFLLESGYKTQNEFWTKNIKSSNSTNDSFLIEILNKSRELPTLKMNCRTVIRKHMNGIDVERKINSLDLPAVILDYILLECI